MHGKKGLSISVNSPLQYLIQDLGKRLHGVFYLLDRVGLGTRLQQDRPGTQMQIIAQARKIDIPAQTRVIPGRLQIELERKSQVLLYMGIWQIGHIPV